MAKFRVEAKFYCYLDEACMQKHVLKEADLEPAEAPEEEGQGKLELSANEEAEISIGTVFAVSRPGKEVTCNYLWVALDHADGFICRSAEDGSNHIIAGERIQRMLDSGEYRESTTKMYNVMAKHKGSQEIPADDVAETQEDVVSLDEAEETETPITADGTSVEEAVNKAISELVAHLDQPLVMSASDNGIWSNKILEGDIEICKDEVHDLLNAEVDGLRAVFVMTLKDKK